MLLYVIKNEVLVHFSLLFFLFPLSLLLKFLCSCFRFSSHWFYPLGTLVSQNFFRNFQHTCYIALYQLFLVPLAKPGLMEIIPARIQVIGWVQLSPQLSYLQTDFLCNSKILWSMLRCAESGMLEFLPLE